MRKNLFIAVEGGEGSGKSTFCRRLANQLKKEGWNVIMTREPGGTPKAEKIREQILNEDHSIYEEIDLFAEARKIHIRELIEPMMKKASTIVLCDRYYMSNLVYQGYAYKNPEETIPLVERANQSILYPDITFFLDIEPQKALGRIIANNREVNLFDKRPIAFHQSVYQGFHSAIRSEQGKGRKIILLDAEQSPEMMIETALPFLRGETRPT